MPFDYKGLTSSCFTCVVVACRWDVPEGATVGFTPSKKPFKDFTSCLKESVNIVPCSKVSTTFIEEFHRCKSQEPLPKAKGGVVVRTPAPLLSYQSALYSQGPSPMSGVSQFLVSLGGRNNTPTSHSYSSSSPTAATATATAAPGRKDADDDVEVEMRNMNLLVIDRDDMTSAPICSLISSVADYVMFVDMGPQTLSEHSCESLAHLSRMRSVFLPAAVASRATILGCSSEYENGGSHARSDPFGGHLAEAIGQYASPSDLPYWVPTNPYIPRTEAISNFFDVLFPEMLFHAAPSSFVATAATSHIHLSLLPPTTTFYSQHQQQQQQQQLSDTSSPCTTTTAPISISPSDVLSFIAKGSDCQIRTSMVSATSPLDDPDPYDYSSLPGEQRLGAAVVADPFVGHSLLPVLMDRYHLRCSLPFRCILMTYFSQRRVALIYVVQGVLKQGDSLMAANLHYMGVVAPESAEGKNIGSKDWGKLRRDCEVTTLKKFPIPACEEDDDSMLNMVAAPGQFVTVQLQCDEEHLGTLDEPTSSPMVVPTLPQDSSSAAATSDSKTNKKTRGHRGRAKQSASGCFFEMLPPYSLCGKFPTQPPATTTSSSASPPVSVLMDIPQTAAPTTVDALFPRPFAVAEWTPSVLHYDNHHLGSLPTDVVDPVVDVTGMYTKGSDGIAKGVLVGGCGRQAICDMIQHPVKPQFGGAPAPPTRPSSAFQYILVNIAAVHNNNSYEMSLDTHTHLLDKPPRRNHTHQPSRLSPPERRAIIVFTIGVGRDTKEIAVVVRLRVMLRKLSLTMAAVDIAFMSIGPTSYKHSFEKNRDDDDDDDDDVTPKQKLKQLRLPCQHIQDLVEGIHLLRGNSKTDIHGSGDASLKALSDEEVAIVRVAAGHELIYELPVILMQELGMLTKDSHRLLPYLPRRQTTNSTPSSAAVVAASDPAANTNTPADAVPETTTTTPHHHHQQLGVWYLLSIALHNLAASNTNWQVVVDADTVCRLDCHHADRDTLLREGLMLAASWHSTAVHTMKPSTALYMSGRTERTYIISCCVEDASFNRAAKGPSIFLEYSNVTKKFWNSKLGDGLPYKVVRRVLMSELTRQWGNGKVVEVMEYKREVVPEVVPEGCHLCWR